MFEAGLAVDPFHFDLRVGLQAAQQGVLADLLSGQRSHLLTLFLFCEGAPQHRSLELLVALWSHSCIRLFTTAQAKCVSPIDLSLVVICSAEPSCLHLMHTSDMQSFLSVQQAPKFVCAW